MKVEEVPQDDGPESKIRRLMWAVDKDGRFTTVQSIGWDPSNTGFNKYWEFLGTLIREARQEVAEGTKSPLHYWMTVNILNECMLADYAGIWTWRVRRHMKPAIFRKLSPELLARYAAIFRISVDELRSLPDKDPADLPLPPGPEEP